MPPPRGGIFTSTMASLEEIRQTRLDKLARLQKEGINSYPATSSRTHKNSDAISSFDTLSASGEKITLAGRVMTIRSQGGLTFFNFDDGSGKFQALLKKGEKISDVSYDLFSETVDAGDFIEVTGTLFVTKRGEKTIQGESWTMLTKSLLPLPDKWHGLQDVEERYRKRYLDIVMNPELKDLFYKKAKFWDVTRRILKGEGFIEVETPTLEVTTGGAEANPFKTHHRDFDLDVYLRISVGELWQKRLMAAGFPKTFEIGRVYRNEGSSPEHLQEFTNLEFYSAYTDYQEGIVFTEKLIKTVAQEVFGTLAFSTRGHAFDLSGEWPRIDYVETVEKMTGVNVLKATPEQMEAKLQELKVKYEGSNRERLTDTLWKYCRKQISGPAWLINHPKLVSPLSKAKTDNPELTERVQLILAGSEMTNGFSELNDPVDQRRRFELQQKLIEEGDSEAMMPEWEFVEMLEHGMPPTFGFAYGDRLFAFLVDKTAREIQLFPLLRPEGHEGKKDKEQKYAVALINSEANLELWQKMNTMAHLNAAFGARVGKNLFYQDSITTADNAKINLNIQHAIMIKEGPTNESIKNVAVEAKKLGLEVEEFTREMILTTNDKKVIQMTKEKKFDEVEYLGVLVFGPKSKVDGLTKDFKLFS